MFNIRKLFFLIFINFLNRINGARILAVIPVASYSHQNFFQPLWRELSLRGHEIVLLTTHPMHDKQLINLTEIDLSFSITHWLNVIKDSVELGEKYGPGAAYEHIRNGGMQLMSMQLRHESVQAIIRNENERFDLVMVEYFDGPSMAFKHRFNCPFIGVLPFDAFSHNHKMMGNAINEIVYPSISTMSLGENADTIIGRARILYKNYIIERNRMNFVRKFDKEIKNIFGADYPSLDELYNSVDMLFINTHPLLNAIRPLTPSTIQIGGGMHLKKPKALSENLQKYLDDGSEGVIYFSLGSSIQSRHIPKHVKAILLKVFAELPYKVLWKFEDDTLTNLPNNVKIHKWLPQQDVLRHSNIKVYIMQGGLQSMEEAIFYGTPIVVMPFLIDQKQNAKTIESKGIGLSLDVKTLTEKHFRDVLLKVIRDDKYRKASLKLAALMKDEPMPPLEKAIWWTEYVLRNKGAQHLKGPNLSFNQNYHIDTIICALSIICIALCLICFLISKVTTYISIMYINKYEKKRN